MSALDDARDRALSELEAFRASRGEEPAWLRQLRDDAGLAFRESGLPHTKLEEWRYTNVAPLAKLPLGAAAPAASPSADAVRAAALSPLGAETAVFVDGRFDAGLSGDGARPGSLAQGIESHPELLAESLGAEVAPKEHAFAALGTAFLEDGAWLRVGPGEQATPAHALFLANDEAPQHPRVLIDVETNASARLVVEFASLGTGSGVTNAVLEARIGDNAQLDLVIVQREHDARFHVANLAVRQGRDSQTRIHTVSLGGQIVRNDANVVLAGSGADCTLNGLFAGRDQQVLDHHTGVDHAVPHCTSRQLYKGILGDRSRGVFRGRVLVRNDAQQTSAEQSNPNLLLAPGAEVNTKPQLEIYADDVKCSHGSTVGQLDDDALFYLQSRGVDAEAGRGLLTRAFAREILDALPDEGLAQALDPELGQRLFGDAAEDAS